LSTRQRSLPDEPAFYVDEDGLQKPLAANPAATHLLLSQENSPFMAEYIRGTIVILHGEDVRWTPP
jgi:hypothetical protein